MADKLSEIIPDDSQENPLEVINQSSTEIIDGEFLENLSVDDILEKCETEAVITPNSIPYENVRNNSKVFLIYFAKSQLRRVVKLSGYLEQLEDQLMLNSNKIRDPDTLMKMISTIQSSMMTAINLIDKVSTDDSYVKLVFNDNRQIINNLNQTISSNNVSVTLSKESREKLRNLADSLLSEVDSAIENGGEFNEIK